MAGTINDFIIYEDEFGNAYREALKQRVEYYNTASQGAIVLTSRSILGNFEKQSFMRSLASASLVKHRDPTSLADIVAEKITQGEKIGVKINRLSYIQNTLDMFKKIGEGEESFTTAAAALTAAAAAEDAFNTAIWALMGSLQVSGGHAVQGDGTTNLDFKGVNALRFAYGDNYSALKVLIMHSTTAKEFVDLNIDEKLDTVAGVTIQTAKIASLGIPILITDSPALDMTVGKAVIGLVDGAVLVVDSEEPTADVQRVQGKQNLVLSMQREWAFNIAVKGISYTDTAISPDNTALADATKWTKVATDNKDIAGVIFNGAV